MTTTIPAGWLPIESAPKDGTEILAWREDCGQFIASYTSADAFPLTQAELDAYDEATLFAKDWFTQWPDATRLDGSEAPTLWQPLPADPCPTCNDQGAVGNILTAQPCPDCAAPGVSTVEDERQAFEAWFARRGVWPALCFEEVFIAGWNARPVDAPAAGDALDAARWRAYARLFPEISASFLATHAVDGVDPLPTIKGAAITGGYVVVTPAGWDADKTTKLRDAILRLFPVNPAHTPRPSDELAAQRKGDA